MLKSISTNNGVVELPGIINTYSINGFDGSVFDMMNGLQIKHDVIGGIHYVTLPRCATKKMWKVSVLQVIAHKAIKLPTHMWGLLSADHVDNDLNNLNAENIVVRFPVTGLEHWHFKGWYYIPNYTRYVINKDTLEIKDTLTLRPIWVHVPKDDNYPSVFLSMDQLSINKNTGYHRLVTLAFHTDYPSNVDILDVNHINGNKKDYAISNVEWNTRSENNIHACKTGLKTDSIAILRKDIISGLVERFYSFADCARNEGKDDWAIHGRVKSGNQKLYDGRFIYKLESDETPWRENISVLDEMRRTGVKRPLKLRNVLNGEIVEVKTVLEASRYVGVSDKNIDYYLRSSNRLGPCKHYDIKDVIDTSDWPSYSEYKLEIIRRGLALNTTVIESTDLETNAKEIWYGVKDLADKLKVTRGHVSDTAKRGGVCNGFKLIRVLIG